MCSQIHINHIVVWVIKSALTTFDAFNQIHISHIVMCVIKSTLATLERTSAKHQTCCAILRNCSNLCFSAKICNFSFKHSSRLCLCETVSPSKSAALSQWDANFHSSVQHCKMLWLQVLCVRVGWVFLGGGGGGPLVDTGDAKTLLRCIYPTSV